MNKWDPWAMAAGLLLVLAASRASAAELNGTLQWLHRTELGMPVSGVVAEVPARIGMAVNKGAVLVRLDDRGLRAELAKAKAERTRLEQVKAEAGRELERAQELYDRTLLSEHELELEKIASATADAQYEAAVAASIQAELALEYSAIRAPFDAVVLEVPAAVGETVVNTTEAMPLVIVAERGRMLARFHLDAASVAAFVPGKEVALRVEERSYTGKVYRQGLEPMTDSDSALYAVDVLFETDQLLRAGQRATVALP